MTINYEWTVENIEAYPKKNGYVNVVFLCHWRVFAKYMDITVSTFGSTNISTDNIKEFTKYEDLTQDKIIDWVKKEIGSERISIIEQALFKQIDKQINPTTVILPLPWQL